MLGEKVIVRVDFYPTGDLIPLGVTSIGGSSQLVDKIVKVEKHAINDGIKYHCLSNGIPLVLIYSKGIWYKEKNVE